MLLMGLMTFIRQKRKREAAENEQKARDAARDAAGDGTGDGDNETDTTGAEGTENATDEGTGATDAGTEQGAPGDTSGDGDVTPGAKRLTTEEFDEIMRNKGNVTTELKKHGVTPAKDDGADKLREDLKAILAEKGLLPDGD